MNILIQDGACDDVTNVKVKCCNCDVTIDIPFDIDRIDLIQSWSKCSWIDPRWVVIMNTINTMVWTGERFESIWTKPLEQRLYSIPDASQLFVFHLKDKNTHTLHTVSWKSSKSKYRKFYFEFFFSSEFAEPIQTNQITAFSKF